MAIDSSFYKQKKSRSIYYALGFLILVILATGGLYFYNWHLQKSIGALEIQVYERENAIDNLRQDKNIEVYYIYNLNKKTFDSIYEGSQISSFVKHAMSTMIGYDLTFDGFNYNTNTITLNATAETNERSLAYTKVAKFLNEYNKNEKSLFVLQPVENFTGQDNIKFSVTFLLQ